MNRNTYLARHYYNNEDKGNVYITLAVRLFIDKRTADDTGACHGRAIGRGGALS